jgi:hypothetical protein
VHTHTNMCHTHTHTQFEQMMDPNVLARFVVPRPLNNFLDNLPSEERLATDGPWTLVEPTGRLIKEVPVP